MIKFGVEARALMLKAKGVEELADAVEVIMGPKVWISSLSSDNKIVNAVICVSVDHKFCRMICSSP